MMTNVEIKKHGIFDKTRKDKRDIGYQTIGGSRSSIESSSAIPTMEKFKTIDEQLTLNAAINLKKSKTFKIIVTKKVKEKNKSVSKKDKTKVKNIKRKRKELNVDEVDNGPEQAKECTQHLFGVSLPEACKYSKSHDGYPLPVFFRRCIDYLETENRLSFEGIYRIPGVNSQISKLKQALSTEVDVVDILVQFDIAVVTSTVKSFLRDLKPDVIERPLESLLFKTIEKPKDNIHEKVSAIKQLISEHLPKENQYLLALVINHMGKIIDMSHQNKMTLENLLIVLSPALHLHFELLKFFYDHSSTLFMELQVPPYIPPIRPGPEHEEDLPETVEEINDELNKQISFLDDLHEQINQGLGTKDMEYLIWEVQLIVTNLKRKKYIAELTDPDLIKNALKKYERQLKRLHKDMLVTGANCAPSNVIDVSTSASNTTTNNDQVTKGAPSSLDQELWQVQRTITTLNRKLKALTTSTKTSNDFVAVIVSTSKIDDDDDDDSIQLNLTLRKVPVGSNEFLNDEDKSEQVREHAAEEKYHCYQENADMKEEILNDTCENVHDPVEEKTMEWLQSQTALTNNSSDKSPDDVNIEENLFEGENDNSTSSNGAMNTTITEDYAGSNSESLMTGSNMATNIEDLIQTGEIWTNEKEELLPEDEDMRNEAIRSLYMREELISIRNDLKTRMASESNEILRLKRNIEELDEERTKKNFRVQNQYHKLNESSSSAEEKASVNLDREDDEDINESSEEDDAELDSSSEDSESIQFSEQTITTNRGGQTAEDVDDDMSDLLRQQRDIIVDNERLEQENSDLLEQIQLERNHCVDLKVTLKTHMLVTCPSPSWLSNMDET